MLSLPAMVVVWVEGNIECLNSEMGGSYYVPRLSDSRLEMERSWVRTFKVGMLEASSKGW